MAPALNKRTLFIVAIFLLRRKNALKVRVVRKRKEWVREIFQYRRQRGEFHRLVAELTLHDSEYFFKYFRMSASQYEILLRMVAPKITKNEKKRADCIGASERLSVTLRYLCTGDSFVSISSSFRISTASISNIIYETCEALLIALNENKYLEAPTTQDMWKKIAAEFYNKWNFPNCIGSIDGKHIVMQAPNRSGSAFFNYKVFFYCAYGSMRCELPIPTS